MPAAPDETTWATYLAHGLYDQSERTFWEGIRSLPPGHLLTWQDGILRIQRWYDVAEATGPDLDCRPPEVVAEEYLALLQESVSLRFRSDVPVGINLSGGLVLLPCWGSCMPCRARERGAGVHLRHRG